MGRDSPNFLPPGNSGDSPSQSPEGTSPFLAASWQRPPTVSLPTTPSFPFSWRPGGVAPVFPPLFSQYLLHPQLFSSAAKPLLSSILPHALPLTIPPVSTPPTSPVTSPSSPSSSPPSLPPLPPTPPQSSAKDLTTNQ